jgi:hypothetical protein
MGASAAIVVAPAWALGEVNRWVPVPAPRSGRYIELVHYFELAAPLPDPLAWNPMPGLQSEWSRVLHEG